MAEYAPLSQGIFCVDAHYVRPGIASIYLLREGSEVAIIETGTANSIDNLLATLDELGIDADQVRYVIPTHVHLDHAGGAGPMMRCFTQASLVIHPRGAAHMINPDRLVAGAIGVYGAEKFERLYGRIEAIAEDRVIVAEDGDVQSLGGRELVFFDTPGHARHHFCIYDEASHGVFTGDTFGISYQPMKRLERGLLPTTPPTQFDPPALHASVERIMDYRPRRLYLTHYGEFDEPSGQVDSFHRWIDEYVELCAHSNPLDEDGAATLRRELGKRMLDNLSDAELSLEAALEVDADLNAMGLAHWWRGQHHG